MRNAFGVGLNIILALHLSASAACVVEVPEDDSDNNRNEFMDGIGGQGAAQAGDTAVTSGDATTGSGNASMNMGGACQCDSDCAAVDGHAGICVYGVCMVKADATCSAGGSTAECPAGSVCWGIQGHA